MSKQDTTAPDILWCSNCKKWVEPILVTGYESGPNPTAYEDYDTCPTCGGDVVFAEEG